MKYVWYYDLPVGRTAIACENGVITDISFGYVSGMETETPETAACAAQLWEYFEGDRQKFDIKLSYGGTEFEKKVFEAAVEIPYGETRSYGDIAHVIGHPRAARAVGNAIHRNRLLIVIPCHRIIKTDGSLGGYGGREDIKLRLLQAEGVHIRTDVSRENE